MEIKFSQEEIQKLYNKLLIIKSEMLNHWEKFLKKYKMNSNFGIITTQNPNKGDFAK